jgi:alpha-galactosidase
MNHTPRPVHLVGGAVSLVLDVTDYGPRVLHWGRRLDEADLDALVATSEPAVMFSSFDRPRRFGLVPVSGEGWSGTPAIAWHRAGGHADPQLVVTCVTESTSTMPQSAAPCRSVRITLEDVAAGARVTVVLSIDNGGLVAAHAEVLSTADQGPDLDLAALRVILPLPARATEVLDQTGRWTRERAPQRIPIVDGAHQRAVRRGRPGHDAPLVTLAGTSGFGFRSGEVWATHIAWSGDHEVVVERLPEGAGTHAAVIAVGELLAPGEIRLGPGETYRSPDMMFAWSDAGIDGVSEAFHRYVRQLDAHPSTPRPLTLNTWEAVYFDHDPRTLIRLVELAARVGVERFVLDDGWFAGRPDDRSGLGDWVVDAEKWPHGVEELAQAVHERGLQFGLWFEPEMLNRDSDVARAHPEWILGSRADAATWRHQLPLDLTRPDVREHLVDRMDHAVRTLALDYIKWDHNRDLHGAVTGGDGAAAVHRQTRGMYAVMDELRVRHPALEIESCASGGARVDLGILARTQRVWASDTNDPVERQAVQRWTGVLVPPELVGSHVGPGRAHTTHREASLPMRLAAALFGHAGIEWDLADCSEDDLNALSRWAAMYKELRPLLHSGHTVRADLADPATMLHGVVSAERDHALFAWVRRETSGSAATQRVCIPGLDPAVSYVVQARADLGVASRHQVADPPWMVATESLRVSGRLLRDVGLPLPMLNPGAALLLEFRADSHTA